MALRNGFFFFFLTESFSWLSCMIWQCTIDYHSGICLHHPHFLTGPLEGNLNLWGFMPLLFHYLSFFITYPRRTSSNCQCCHSTCGMLRTPRCSCCQHLAWNERVCWDSRCVASSTPAPSAQSVPGNITLLAVVTDWKGPAVLCLALYSFSSEIFLKMKHQSNSVI